MILDKPYNKEAFDAFLAGFLPDYKKDEREVRTPDSSIFTKVTKLGGSKSQELDVTVLEAKCEETDSNRRIAITQAAFKVLRDHQIRNAIVAFHDGSDQWRLSLLTSALEIKDGKVIKKDSNPRRYSYVLGHRAKTVTPYKYLIEKGRANDMKQLQERFSVEVVNKQFYASIADLFTKLVGGERGATKYPGLLKIKSVISQNVEHQEFAVRLIGRIIFSWFLKEKKSIAGVPIVPNELLSLDAVASNADYYHSILEPLFFELLNKRVENRHESLCEAPFSTVPYLNGGLFSPHQGDFYNQNSFNGAGTPGLTQIPDEWFKELFEVLNQYNFTVDENTSYDVDLSIDPEMLGRIFENLLAEINPETGETARKSTGSFYTPREIVDYMVDSSLLEFLKNKTGVEEDSLKALISWGQADDDEHPLTDNEKQKVVTALAGLTILDPACGSGAFPIGILQKVVYILQQADPKAEIWLENQLRNITSPELKRDIQEKYESENYDWLRKYGVIRETIFGIDIQTIATEISKLRCFLTLIIEEVVDDEKPNRGVHALPNLDFKFVTANSLVSLPDSNANAKSKGLNLFEDASHIEQLKYIRNQYFGANADERARLQVEFKNLQMDMLRSRIASSNSTSDLYNELSDWDPFGHKATKWFDSEWMFGVDGFDIVIANPPYVDYRKINNDYVKNMYKIAKHSKMINLYTYFYELGLKNIVDGGILCYISPQQYLVLDNCKGLRDLIRQYTLVSLSDYSMANVFTAGTYPFVTVIRKDAGHQPAAFHEYDQIHDSQNYIRELTLPNPITEPVNISEFGGILSKMTISGRTLGDVSESIFVASSSTQERLPMGSGKYKFVEASNVMRNKIEKVASSINQSDLYSTNSIAQQTGSIIYTSRMTDVIRAVLIDNSDAQFMGGKINVVKPYKDSEYVVSLLNSKAVNFWFRQRFGMTHMQGGALPINAADLKKIPLPQSTEEQRSTIATLFDVQQYEEIDQYIYDLYNLTPKEISIVESGV